MLFGDTEVNIKRLPQNSGSTSGKEEIEQGERRLPFLCNKAYESILHRKQCIYN